MKSTIRQLLTRAKIHVQDQKGLGLVESMVAVAILGSSTVAFVVALSAGSIAVREQDQQVVAQSLVQAQLEYVKSYNYDPGATTYPAVNALEGYSVSVEVDSILESGNDTDIQRITATVWRGGDNILSVEDYKVNR